ncbi:phosphopentomutase 1 [Firmicutes bacterium CAG:313]|nr:phosphopentomutase 1 [Firmicutes bacterium CAG:313]
MENKKFKRIFVIVTDSMGIGAAYDAKKYDDLGANTFGHIANLSESFNVPTLTKLGIGNICPNNKTPFMAKPMGIVARMIEQSVGKDTLTGHFEMMGLKVTTPFPSFTETGFPKELIDDLEQFSGRKVIGNKSASGTEIIKELGEEQLKTGALIVYTSADSVLQIAANEAVIPLDELYKICAYARKITIENKAWQVGRIIARPFVGTSKDNFTRTTNRHDYALKPFAKTTLNFLQEKGYDVVAIGKINDIFDGYGVTEATRTVSNHDGMLKTTAYLDKDFTGLCFTNLVDFDALYGHRRNLPGYRMAIEEFDVDLKNFIEKMHNDDLVIVVADHGNDPIHHGTDHTREMVPFICYHKHINGRVLPDFDTFANVGATICDNFNCEMPKLGTSVLGEITK